MKTWRERVVEARWRGYFSDGDLDAAQSWLTCAVGEQRRAMPDVVVYIPAKHLASRQKPADHVLRRLGGGRVGFWRAVRSRLFDEAERLLDAIEDRVLQLKREQP